MARYWVVIGLSPVVIQSSTLSNFKGKLKRNSFCATNPTFNCRTHAYVVVLPPLILRIYFSYFWYRNLEVRRILSSYVTIKFNNNYKWPVNLKLAWEGIELRLYTPLAFTLYYSTLPQYNANGKIVNFQVNIAYQNITWIQAKLVCSAVLTPQHYYWHSIRLPRGVARRMDYIQQTMNPVMSKKHYNQCSYNIEAIGNNAIYVSTITLTTA